MIPAVTPPVTPAETPAVIPAVTPLRRAVLVTVVSGQLASAVAGVLPWAALAGAAPLLVVAALAAAGADERRARLLRGGATAVAGLLALLVLPRALAAGEPREVLGPLLVGVSVLSAATWRTRRDLQGGLLTGLGLLVLGASFAPDVLVGLPLLVGWGAAVTAGVLAGRERTAEQVDLVLPGGAPRPLLPVTLATVLGLVAFLLLPTPQDAALRSRLAAAARAGDTTRAALGAGVFSGGRVDLSVRGDLGPRPLLEVPGDSPELWRGAVYDTWDGRSWTARGRDGIELAGPPYVVEGVEPERTDDVRVLGPSDGTVLAPGRPVVLETGARRVLRSADGALRAQGLVAQGPGGYRVGSVRPPVPAPVLPGEDVTDPRWLQLPAGTSPRVRDLARTLAAGRDRPAAVAAVESWLRANATYRTDSPVPGPGEDAVDRFLFVDRTGFCEQFAAAEVVLLRAAGVPARFVSGVAYGEPADAGRRTYRERDLHTWVEVFHPGVGWVESDPTAGTALAVSAAASLRAEVADRLARALLAVDDLPGGRAGAAGVLLLGLVLLLRRPRPRRPVDVVGGPAVQAFTRWDAGRRGPAETVGELRARLPVTEQEAHALTVVEAECYAPEGAPPSEVAKAVGALSAGGRSGASRASGGGRSRRPW